MARSTINRWRSIHAAERVGQAKIHKVVESVESGVICVISARAAQSPTANSIIRVTSPAGSSDGIP
jgi:hypothetical protein